MYFPVPRNLIYSLLHQRQLRAVMERFRGPPQTDGESDCNEQNYFSLHLIAVQLAVQLLCCFLSMMASFTRKMSVNTAHKKRLIESD